MKTLQRFLIGLALAMLAPSLFGQTAKGGSWVQGGLVTPAGASSAGKILRPDMPLTRMGSVDAGSITFLDPRALGNLAAWYDSSDSNSLIYNASNQLSLWGDKSGNSGVGSARSVGMVMNGIVIANGAQVADAAALRITGDIDLRGELALSNWTNPVNSPAVVTKLLTPGQYAYDLYISTSTGQLLFRYSPDGTVLRQAASSVATGFSPYQRSWVRATYASGTGAVLFYTSTDGTNWTQLGTPQSLTPGTIFAGTNNVQIGQESSTNNASGTIYRAQILNGINGTLVLDVNFVGQQVNAASFTENSSNAFTVTIQGSALLAWIDPTSSDGLYLPGTGNAYASAPDSVPVSITGDVDLRAYVNIGTLAGGELMSKWGAAGQRSYELLINSASGDIRLNSSNDGTASFSFVSSANITVGKQWIRATLDVDNGASGKTCTFYTSADGTTWNLLGVAQTQASTTTVFDSTAPIEIGSRTTGTNLFNGVIYRAQIYNGIGGTLVFDANFVGQTPFVRSIAESSTNAATVTLNGTSSLPNMGSSNCFASVGSTAQNYVSSPDSVSTSIVGNVDLFARVAAEDWTPGGERSIVGKWTSAGNQRSYVLHLLSTGVLRLYWSNDGVTINSTDSTAAVAFTDLSAGWVRGTMNVNDGGGNRVVKFYTATDTGNNAEPVWTQLGTTVTTAGVTTIFDSTSIVSSGAVDSGNTAVWAGRIHRSVIRSGYDGAGSIVWDANFGLAPKLATAFVESSTNAAVVTLVTSSTAASARISGPRDLWQPAAANSPIFLSFDGSRYSFHDGVAGSCITTPDSAPVSVTGDIDIQAYAGALNWQPGGNNVLCAKWNGTGSSSYIFRFGATGVLNLTWSADGTAVLSAQSTVGVSFAAVPYAKRWVRVTRQASTGTVKFYESVNGSSWTQVGTTVAATSGNIFDGVDSFVIGARGNTGVTEPLTGKIYQVKMYNGYDGAGSLVFNYDPASYVNGTTLTDAASSLTLTLNVACVIISGNCVYADGTNDHVKSPMFPYSQPETVYIVGQQDTWGGDDWIFDGGTGSSMIFQQTAASVSPNVSIFAGTLMGPLTTYAMKTNSVATTLYNAASSAIRWNRTAAVTGNAGSLAGNGLTVFCNGNIGGQFSNIVSSEILLYSAAHDTSTQDSVAIYEQLKWGLVF